MFDKGREVANLSVYFLRLLTAITFYDPVINLISYRFSGVCRPERFDIIRIWSPACRRNTPYRGPPSKYAPKAGVASTRRWKGLPFSTPSRCPHQSLRFCISHCWHKTPPHVLSSGQNREYELDNYVFQPTWLPKFTPWKNHRNDKCRENTAALYTQIKRDREPEGT